MDASEMRKRVFSLDLFLFVEIESIFESGKKRERERKRVSSPIFESNWWNRAIQPNRKSEGNLKRVGCVRRSSLKNGGTDPHRNLAFNQQLGYRENLWPSALCKKVQNRYPSQRAIIENTVRVYFWEKNVRLWKHPLGYSYVRLVCPCVRLSLSRSSSVLSFYPSFSFALLFPSFLAHYFSFLLSRCKIAIPGRGRIDKTPREILFSFYCPRKKHMCAQVRVRLRITPEIRDI